MNANSKANFFSLPPEIRAEIYELSLVLLKDTIWVKSPLKKGEAEDPDIDSFFNDPIRRLSPALLRVSRQINLEATPIFYRKNSFGFIGDSPYTDLRVFLHEIGEANRACLGRLDIRLPIIKKVWVSPVDGASFDPKDTEQWPQFNTSLVQRYCFTGEGVEEALQGLELRCPNLKGIWLRVGFDDKIGAEKLEALERLRRIGEVRVVVLELPYVEGNAYINATRGALDILEGWGWTICRNNGDSPEKWFLF
ncbi:hypothetical protein FGG08_001145 [Glutinoglossum americanum]|uniref:2EXR domain-containing protein n=1 Tax=Glutinoglossum americanum TaxID=1670608 RepID=A0A9P8IHC1_9PEZI|nr:hypothetical protein FGG08_001145 [Glutinoglossum americanum]